MNLMMRSLLILLVLFFGINESLYSYPYECTKLPCYCNEMGDDSKSKNLSLNFLMPYIAKAQLDTVSDPDMNSNIKIIGKAYSDSIVLRFATKDYSSFLRALKNGIKIQKGTDRKNLKTIATVFPIPIDKLKLELESIQKDTYSIIAVGLLYGDKSKTEFSSHIDNYRAQEQIHGMSLLTAEFSAGAANILGLRYIDKEVTTGLSYYYFASITNEDSLGSKLEIINNFEEQREPYKFLIDTGDGFLKLRWSKVFNQKNFSYYWVERSIDNKEFYPIMNKPLVMLESEASKDDIYYEYVDSFNIVNDQKYYYRFYGGSSFAEYSKPAHASGIPKDRTPPAPPTQFNVKFDENFREFQMEWDFNLVELSEDFDHFQILHSRSASGPYTAISPELDLSDGGFDYKLKETWNEEDEGKHYFVCNVYDDRTNYSSSIPVIVNVPDYTSPQSPLKFSGYIDSLGIVRLNWNKSSSKDVNGYWLYWSHDPNAEFSLVKQEMISDTSYNYYIPEKSLNKFIYYTLKAEDFAFNRSLASEVLKVQRLDKIAPIRPSIAKINNDSSRIKLVFNLSPSEDVFVNELFRKKSSSEDTTWSKVITFSNVQEFIDTTAELNINYQYKVRAIDTTGNKSDFSPIKNATRSVDKSGMIIKNFKLARKSKGSSVELQWNFELPSSIKNSKYNYAIYRSTGIDGLKFYKLLPSDNKNFIESNLQSNVMYNYAIQIITEDGLAGSLSETKSILIQ